MNNAYWILIIGLMSGPFLIDNAYAQSCVETQTCPTNVPILTYLSFPFTELMGDYFYVIVWGVTLVVLYMTTGNGILVSIVGLIIASLLTAYTSIATDTSTGSPFYWGYIMVGISFGIGVYYIIRAKTSNP